MADGTMWYRAQDGNYYFIGGVSDSAFYSKPQEINAQTGTSYAVQDTDAGKLITLTNVNPITISLPQDSDESIPIGTYVFFYQGGAGQVSLVAGTGASTHTYGSANKLLGQYARAAAQKIAANTWSLMGELTT